MGIVDETRFVERIQFFNGQRLLASDLQGLEAFNREMRWLHNSSLHQPGIGSGFAITGKKGAREVQISPGYAIDAQGREIVLTQAHPEPVPPVAGADNQQPAFFDLVVSYPSDSDLEEAETRQGICCPIGAVRLVEEPVFCWIRLRGDEQNLRPENPRLRREIEEGMRIALARAEVLDCRLNRDLSVAQRRDARPARQPWVACGIQEGGWRVANETLGKPFALQAIIDTKEGAFLTQPRYMARIEGNRPLTNVEDSSLQIFDVVVYVKNPTATGFEVLALTVGSGLDGSGNNVDIGAKAKLILEAAEREWRIVWMGIEG